MTSVMDRKTIKIANDRSGAKEREGKGREGKGRQVEGK
jgi:hypothetical protein